MLTPIRDLEPAIDGILAQFVMMSLEMRMTDRPQNVSGALQLLHQGVISSFGVGATGPQHTGTGVDSRKFFIAITAIILSLLLISYFNRLSFGR